MSMTRPHWNVLKEECIGPTDGLQAMREAKGGAVWELTNWATGGACTKMGMTGHNQSERKQARLEKTILF